MNRNDINLRTLLEQEFDLSDQSIETFLERLRTSYQLQGLIFFCPSYPGRRASKGTIPPLRGRRDAEKSNWLSSLRRMTGVAWSQTQRRNAPLPFVLVGAGGSRQFVSIPVHAPNGVWAFLIATSNESDAEWEVRRDRLLSDLKHIAQHMYRRMAAMLMTEDQIDFSAITRRETEALKLASHGKSGGEIAIEMGISGETAREHLDSARVKLHALNRTHALVLPLRCLGFVRRVYSGRSKRLIFPLMGGIDSMLRRQDARDHHAPGTLLLAPRFPPHSKSPRNQKISEPGSALSRLTQLSTPLSQRGCD